MKNNKNKIRKCVSIITTMILMVLIMGCSKEQGAVETEMTQAEVPMGAATEMTKETTEETTKEASKETSKELESTTYILETVEICSVPLQTTAQAVEESFVAKLAIAEGEKQLIIVEATGNKATVTMHEKIDGYWKEIMHAQGYVGKNGVGKASESDTKTPAGKFTLSHAFGVEKDPGSTIGYVQVGAEHYWVDDPDSKYYNKFVSSKEIDATNWKSAEHLVDYPVQYAYAVAIDYNLDCVPGDGSAIFLHCANGMPTYGCVSIPKEDMAFVLTHLQEDCKIVIEESGKGLLEK